MRNSRPVASLLIASVLVTGLIGCAGPIVADNPTAASTGAPATEETATPTAAGDSPEWANSVTNPGELLTTIAGTDFQVEIYQVGTVAATKPGNFVNPDTNKPIIEVGAELVYVNYVFTNTGPADIPLSYNLVAISARYADWPYLQGMDNITDFALDESMKINNTAIAPNKGEAPFAWPAGTSFSYGQNFLYQAGSQIEFAATLTPSDASGDLDHDKKQEVAVSTSIK
ncbi:hypothetical protein [Salinibacterium sp.]|uniref:hypothetical protein n=1 Tax=Salinibacterium sp. TaxID=1915057 RepID=UPI00286ACA1A|nr:hypothetical protein [Salinibacterium sp.]